MESNEQQQKRNQAQRNKKVCSVSLILPQTPEIQIFVKFEIIWRLTLLLHA